jgi:hypothetical protein
MLCFGGVIALCCVTVCRSCVGLEFCCVLFSSRLVSSRLVSSRLVSSRLVVVFVFVSSRLRLVSCSSRLVSSRLISSRLVLFRLDSSRLVSVSSRLISSRLRLVSSSSRFVFVSPSFRLCLLSSPLVSCCPHLMSPLLVTLLYAKVVSRRKTSSSSRAVRFVRRLASDVVFMVAVHDLINSLSTAVLYSWLFAGKRNGTIFFLPGFSSEYYSPNPKP